MKIAIIGTAGRNKSIPMTYETWQWMVRQAKALMPKGLKGEHIHLVSGGAAWADHLAVHLFLIGMAQELTLHLPAPLDASGYFMGYRGTAGSVANYYHSKFSLIAGINSREEILEAASRKNCHGTVQPVAPGYGAMFARNRLIAKELDKSNDQLIAFTFGKGDSPEDGGTRDTWNQFQGDRFHVSIQT